MSQKVYGIKDNVKAIEIQVGQIANIIGRQHKQGQFPSNTELNPKEQCKVIKLRSDTSYEGPKMSSEEKKKVLSQLVEEECNKKINKKV